MINLNKRTHIGPVLFISNVTAAIVRAWSGSDERHPLMTVI